MISSNPIALNTIYKLMNLKFIFPTLNSVHTCIQLITEHLQLGEQHIAQYVQSEFLVLSQTWSSLIFLIPLIYTVNLAKDIGDILVFSLFFTSHNLWGQPFSLPLNCIWICCSFQCSHLSPHQLHPSSRLLHQLLTGPPIPISLQLSFCLSDNWSVLFIA